MKIKTLLKDREAACELNVRPSAIIWSMVEGLKQASGKTDG
jgi:hypothetical protein